MASGSVVAAVVLMLLHRNRLLIDQLADDARTDALTGVFNRRGFDERARIELARARRDRDAIAVVTFDIDFFKRVNDEWGHQIGDMVLARLGAILKAEARDLDVVARFGGEEFVVLLPSCDSACAEVFATRIRAVLAAQDPGALPTVRVSAGVTASIAPEDLNTLLRAADAAMYEAKRAGRDRTVVVEHEAPPRHEEPGRLLAARLS
jgi:diguanylate cyclase (GGDEF)-like protein